MQYFIKQMLLKSLTQYACTKSAFLFSGTAGVIISLSRISTKFLIKDERKNTIIFFLISIGMELMCFILHLLVRRTRFVRYYTSLARQGLSHSKDRTHHNNQYHVHHDVITEDVRFVSTQLLHRLWRAGCVMGHAAWSKNLLLLVFFCLVF